jgi:hypothetical protein
VHTGDAAVIGQDKGDGQGADTIQRGDAGTGEQPSRTAR